MWSFSQNTRPISSYVRNVSPCTSMANVNNELRNILDGAMNDGATSKKQRTMSVAARRNIALSQKDAAEAQAKRNNQLNFSQPTIVSSYCLVKSRSR